MCGHSSQLYADGVEPVPATDFSPEPESDKESSSESKTFDPLVTTLAADPQWLRLMKVTRSGKNTFTTDILSTNFYLAGALPPSPVDELHATITAFKAPFTADTSHAQCRFPARLYWLKQKIPTLAETLPQVNCTELDAWVQRTVDKNFYLVHVSGYFANPASAFGHLLFRIGDGSGKRGLLDAGINFGARIPPTDGSVRYMYNGLFGGYTASFSTKDHYVQDKVYSGTESRDMWAYQLQLTDEQAALFRYHLWELMDQPFKYYFLKKNCAYRMAEVLEFVYDTDFFVDEKSPYYAPVQLFDKLEQHQRNHNNSTYSSLEFIPSHKRETFTAFNALDNAEAAAANRVLKTSQTTDATMSEDSLDFLLDYLDYKIQGAAEAQLEALQNLKRQVVRKRLTLPPRADSPLAVPALAAPGGGPRPATLRFGLVQEQPDDALDLSISPFWYDLLDANRGSLIDSAFRALVLNLRVSDEELKFNRLTLLDIQKYTPAGAAIVGERAFTWRGAAAIRNRDGCSGFCPVAAFAGSIGKSLEFGSGLVYATLDAELTSSLVEQDVSASIGSLRQLTPKLRGRWNSSYTLYSKNELVSGWLHQIQMQYTVSQQHAIDFSWERRVSNAYTLGYKFKW